MFAPFTGPAPDDPHGKTPARAPDSVARSRFPGNRFASFPWPVLHFAGQKDL